MDDAYRKHCEDMRRGSDMLRDAILAHLRGTAPATRLEPVKLPPDFTGREYQPRPSRKRKVQRPTNERVKEFMDLGMSAGQIGAELNISQQKARSIMQIIRNRRSPTELDLALKAKLWG